MNQPLPPGLKIIVVDDQDDARRTVLEYLRAMGFKNLFEAEDGYVAHALIQQESIGLIICDWEMPHLNGIDLLKALKHDLSLKDIPFIMITSPGSQEQIKVEAAALSQVDAYLLKPFRMASLREKIETILTERMLDDVRGAIVVDDEPEVRETIAEILASLGHMPIFHASNGEEGFELLRKHSESIGIVVSDWEMPKVTGIELLNRIRADKELRYTPFLMVTSQTSVEHLKLDAAIRAEVDQYLMKPFTVEALRTKVVAVQKKAHVTRKISKRLQSAQMVHHEGDYFNAERIYRHVLSLDSKCVDAYLGLASIRLGARPDKGYDEAIYFIREAIAINPALEMPHVELALVYEKALSLDKAITVLKEAMKTCHPSGRLHFQLGRLMFKIGRLPEASIELGNSLRLDPTCAEAQLLLMQTSISERKNPKR